MRVVIELEICAGGIGVWEAYFLGPPRVIGVVCVLAGCHIRVCARVGLITCMDALAGTDTDNWMGGKRGTGRRPELATMVTR